MDEELRNAALIGDVEFLKKCVESHKPIEYYTANYPQCSNKGDRCHGNIFHMATDNNREEFIRESINHILPRESTHQLLLQPREPLNVNPLHVAAGVGNVEIVKMFLEVYQCLPTLLTSDPSKRPWLQQDSLGNTPCYTATVCSHEECALEILRMDMELLCNIPDNRDSYIIHDALANKLTKLALEILKAPHNIGCSGPMGRNLFRVVSYLHHSEEAEEIFQLLLQRNPRLIEQRNEIGSSIFYHWGKDGKIWPFKCLLESHEIIPYVNRVFVCLVSSTDIYGYNPLHNLAESTSSEEIAIKIAKLLIDVYKQEASSSIHSKDVPPWLLQDKNYGDTPLSMAISHRHEKFAMYILSVDEHAVSKTEKNVLFLAIENGCHEIADKILDIVNMQRWTHLLYNDNNKNILHLATSCKSEAANFCRRLIQRYPELLQGKDKGGVTILHNWVKNGDLWFFIYNLESKWRSTFIKLIKCADYNDWNNPFHVAAMVTTNEAINQIVELLVTAYKEEFPYWKESDVDFQPWFTKNKASQGPLHFAICNQHEKLALHILSLHEDRYINALLDYYEPQHTILFLAIQNNCQEVVKHILSRLDKNSRTKYLKDSSNGRNLLHCATRLKDKDFGTWLVNEAPEFITQKDNNEQSAWDKAYELGPAWFIEAVLRIDSNVFSSAPLAWIKACKNGHVLALCAFIEFDPGAFRNICIEFSDSPLHHIKLSSLTEYEDFLDKTPRMKDLINLQDSQGQTPLHKAIQNDDLFMAETLLNNDKINFDIKDDKNESAIDLLAKKYDENKTWERMCKRIGLDPKIKTTYFQTKTNLLEVRSSLFVVAALLATITFTAGFTLPGGFTQDTGEAILAKKTAFLVFLVSNTLALAFSMLVLLCLIWSMVYDFHKSLILIDRSMVLLRIALNCTLLAFMTGVYIVIAPKSLWAAILIIAIVSPLIGISFDKSLFYNVLQYIDRIFSFPSKKCINRFGVMENGVHS